MKQSVVVKDLHAGEEVRIPSLGVRVQMIHKSGRVARLRITAPTEAKIEGLTDEQNPVPCHVPSMAT